MLFHLLMKCKTELPSDLNELVSESLAAGHGHLGFASSFELENDGVTVFNLYNFQDFSKPDKYNMKNRTYPCKLRMSCV